MQIVVALFLVVLCAMSIISTRWMFAFALVFFAFEVALEGSLELFRTNLTYANYIVGTITLFSLAKTLPTKDHPLRGYLNVPYFITLAIFIWSIISLIWSPAVSTKHDTGASIILALWPQFILTIILVPLLLMNIDEWREMLPKFIFIGGFTCLMILLNPEFTFKNARIGADLPGGMRTSPLAIGQIGGLIALFSGLYFPERNNLTKLLFRLTGFLLGAWLALSSGSRGQILFAAILIAVFYPISRKLENIKSFIVMMVGFAALALLGYFIFAFTSESEFDRWSTDNLSRGANIRTSFIYLLLSNFMSAPHAWIIGLGFNAFSTFGGIYGQGYSHNISIDILTELGIPMFVSYVVILYLTARSCIGLYNYYKDDPPNRAAVSVLIAMFIYQFLLANKEGNLWSSTNLFMVMIVITKFYYNSKEEFSQDARDDFTASLPAEDNSVQYEA